MMVKHINKYYFGKEFIISIYSCCDDIHNIDFWSTWFSELINLIDMKAHGPLHIEKFGEGDLHGISAMQFIETSSIVMHTDTKNNGIHLNIFSCKDFDEYLVNNYIYKTLHPDIKSCNMKLIYR